LIANRGEIALRILRTCKDMGIETAVIHSEVDADALHVRFGGREVCVGPAAAKDSYLNIPHIISAARITGANAIHPGYGFLAENSRFSEACSESGLIFIGPTPEMINKLGDKITGRQIAIEEKVPVIPGSPLLNDIKMAKKEARKIGYPVIIKATAGGGGKGMRVVIAEKDLEDNFTIAKREAHVSFNNDGIFLEKYLENPKHIEIQILSDSHGNIVHLGERDCSLQRNHQKIIEEAPSPVLGPSLRKEMGKAAVRLVKKAKYIGIGTLEFLYEKEKFYFIEMNTRIQVEHPVTEMISGVDIVAEQIRIAGGAKLGIKNLEKPIGHSIEFRINAENPEKNWMPSSGKITDLHFPGGLGVRIDSHIYAGYDVPPYYDSMLGKLIIFGKDRAEAIARSRRALEEMVVLGIHTTTSFHQKIIETEEFQKGTYSTRTVPKFLSR